MAAVMKFPIMERRNAVDHDYVAMVIRFLGYALLTFACCLSASAFLMIVMIFRRGADEPSMTVLNSLLQFINTAAMACITGLAGLLASTKKDSPTNLPLVGAAIGQGVVDASQSTPVQTQEAGPTNDEEKDEKGDESGDSKS